MFIIFKNRTDNDNILEKNDEDDNDDVLTNEEFVKDIDENIDSDNNDKEN